eukprot:364782-Chlamydomonas_euryale.AAC.1
MGGRGLLAAMRYIIGHVWAVQRLAEPDLRGHYLSPKLQAGQQLSLLQAVRQTGRLQAVWQSSRPKAVRQTGLLQAGSPADQSAAIRPADQLADAFQHHQSPNPKP